MKIARFKELPTLIVVNEYTTEKEPWVLIDFVVLQFWDYQLEFPANLFDFEEIEENSVTEDVL